MVRSDLETSSIEVWYQRQYRSTAFKGRGALP